MNVHSSIIKLISPKRKLKFVLSNEWVNKMWYIHTIEYFSPKKKYIYIWIYLIWLNIENRLSKRNQTLHFTHYMISFILNVQDRQICKNKLYRSVATRE